MIKADGIVDKKSLNEIKLSFVSPLFSIYAMTVIAIYFSMALIEFAHSKEMFVIYLFHTAINLMAYFYCIFSHVTTKLNCIKVLFNTDVLIYAVEFEQEQMSISYPEIGSISLSYSDFYKIIETKNYFTMFYKKNLPLIIVKNTLSVSEKSWKDFVAKQCICAKKIKFSS